MLPTKMKTEICMTHSFKNYKQSKTNFLFAYSTRKRLKGHVAGGITQKCLGPTSTTKVEVLCLNIKF